VNSLASVVFVVSMLCIVIPLGGKPLADGGAIDDPRRALVLAAVYSVNIALVASNRLAAFLMVRSLPVFFFLLVFVLFSVAWSEYPMKVVVTMVHLSGAASIAMVGVIAARARVCLSVRLIWMASSLVVVGSFLLLIVSPDAAYGQFFEERRFKGLVEHPNIFGKIASLAVWSSTALLFYNSRKMLKISAAFVVVVASYCLFLADSVTSMIVSFAGAVGIFALVAGFSRGIRPSVGRTVAIALPLVLLLVALVPFLFPDIVSEATAEVNRKGNLSGRTDLWVEGWQAFLERPFVGWGADGLRTFSEEHDMVWTHFHNGYLDALVRLGLVGGGLAIWIVYSGLLRSLRFARSFSVSAYAAVVLTAMFLTHNVTETAIAKAPNFQWTIYTLVVLVVSAELGARRHRRDDSIR
jgi:exopolysaccharide production protein ExoQ